MNDKAKRVLALVVDDNEINRMICEDLLLEFNIQSVLADSGKQALIDIENNDFDIIFIDHVMPGMDGIELCRRIRAMGGKPAEVPVIVLTGNDVERYKRAYIDAGMDGWITKPVSYEDMARLLSDRLGIGSLEKRQSKTAGTDSKLLKSFLAQTREKIPIMEQYISEGRFAVYSIEAHSFKSSLINIGENKLAEDARELERLANNGSYEAVIEKNPVFIKALRECSKKTAELLEELNGKRERPAGNMDELCEKLETAKNLLDDFEASDAADIIRELAGYTYGQYDKQLEELDVLFDSYAFDRIGGLLSGLILSVKYTKGE